MAVSWMLSDDGVVVALDGGATAFAFFAFFSRRWNKLVEFLNESSRYTELIKHNWNELACFFPTKDNSELLNSAPKSLDAAS